MNRRDLTIVNALGILDNPNAQQSLDKFTALLG